MIKDAQFAMRERLTGVFPEAVLRYVPGANLEADEPIPGERMLFPKLEVKNPFVFPKNPPSGVLYGLTIPGQVPKSIYELDQLKKDWAVIRTTANMKECNLDQWPPIEVPIVVMIEGRGIPVEGMIVTHEIEDENSISGVSRELVFLEVIREGSCLYSVGAPVKFGIDGAVEQKSFVPQDWNKVIAWNYLSVDGLMIRAPKFSSTTELFIDCEFEDSAKRLISVGLVTKDGQCYYAFDSDAANSVKENWVEENVIPVLFDVPKNTIVIDLNAKKMSFQDWLKATLEEIHETWNLSGDVIIHTDFPTDVDYISGLLHLGEGKRIGYMKTFTFQIDYVDAYPTPIESAVQHNAMWDAVALWHHLGYYQHKVMQDVINGVPGSAEWGQKQQVSTNAAKVLMDRIQARQNKRK